MSAYTTSYAIRYTVPHLQQQIEVATIQAASDIINEDPSTPDHTARWDWANWVLGGNSSVAWAAFAWQVALNPTIQGAVESEPSGQSVQDSDVQFVVNANLDAVIAGWKPPA